MKRNFWSAHRAILRLGIVCLLLVSSTVIAVVTRIVANWEDLFKTSPNVVVARCTKTPDEYETNKAGALVVRGGPKVAPINIVYTLKGVTNLGPASFESLCWPRQGEYYLIFADHREGTNYEADSQYSVVPLGIVSPPTFLLTGKPFEEQVKILLKYRLKQLNQELLQMKREKTRLEEFVGSD